MFVAVRASGCRIGRSSRCSNREGRSDGGAASLWGPRVPAESRCRLDFLHQGPANRGVARYVAQCSGEASLGAAIHGAPRPHPQRLQQRRDATGAGMVRERGPFERELLQHGDDHAFAGMLPTAHERRSDIEIGVAVQDHIALEGEGMARARIFTPPAEIPFAGHTTFGAALVLAAARQAHGRRAPAA